MPSGNLYSGKEGIEQVNRKINKRITKCDQCYNRKKRVRVTERTYVEVLYIA